MSASARSQRGLSEDQVALRETIRDIAVKRVAPRAAQIDEQAEYPADLRALFAAQDMLGLPIAAEYGGMGTGALTFALAVEEVAAACASTAGMLVALQLGTLPIALHGSDAQRDTLLPACAAGERTPALAVSTGDRGDVVAARDGDRWTLNGTTGRALGAGRADFYIVVAQAPGATEPTAFVVDADAAGVDVDAPDTKVGVRGLPSGRISLTDVCVPDESVLGAEGDGAQVARDAIDGARTAIAAQALGIARAALEYADLYASERRQFGRPIADFEGIQVKLADMEIGCAAGRELLHQACAQADDGHRTAPRYAAMAKVLCSDVAVQVAGEAVQILGGYGFVREYPVERHLRDAKATQVYVAGNAGLRLQISRHH